MAEFGTNFRKTFSKLIMQSMFSKYLLYLVEEEDELFGENNTLNGLPYAAHSYFLYQGKLNIRLLPDGVEIIKPLKTILDSSLEDRMHMLTEDKAATDNEYRAILAYVKRLLNLSNSVEDIYCLWPTDLNPYWTDSMEELRMNSTQTLRPEVIEDFKIQTKSSLVYIKERKFKNLLLG